MGKFKVAIVIPAYNEAATISKVVNSVKDFGTVIVVNDNSSDNTSSLAESAGATVINLKPNKGYEGAIQEGFKYASPSFDFILTMDADGQHTREAVQAVLEKLTSNSDMIVGVRNKFARFSETLFSNYFRLRFGLKDALCGLKLYKSSLFTQAGVFDTQKLVGSELMFRSLKDGASFIQVPIEILDREDESRYGSVIKANYKILKALGRVIKMDIKG